MRRKPMQASPKELRSISLSLKIKPSLKDALAKAADEEGRSVSQFCERALETLMRASGHLK